MNKFAALKRLRWIAENQIEYRKHFDMGYWFDHSSDHPVQMRNGAPVMTDCGTTACLLGWGAADARFRKAAGLRWVTTNGLVNLLGALSVAPKLRIDDDCDALLFRAGLSPAQDKSPATRKRTILRRIDAVLKANGVYAKIPNTGPL